MAHNRKLVFINFFGSIRNRTKAVGLIPTGLLAESQVNS